MGKISLKDKVCFLLSLALMQMCSSAEREYFLQSRNLNWEEARSHCRACFKDLVTLTPENIQTIIQNLTSECWIGLRKNFNSIGNFNSTSHSNSTSDFNSNSTSDFNSTSNSNSTSDFNFTSNSNSSGNSSMHWSRWANGDPLTFQNWYPGWPMLKSSLPKKHCCSCSCTCPTRPTPTVLRGLTSPSVTRGATTHTSSFTHQNATGVTDGVRESSTQNVTDVTGIWESSTQNVTDVTGVWESSTQNVTDVTGIWESSTQNVTDVTGVWESSTQNATDVTEIWESSTQNVTGVTGVLESSTQNVTGVTGVLESSTQNMATSTEWRNPTVFTTAAPTSTSLPPVEAECVRSPILSDDPDPDENYIEDSCVAMLSFGAWVEKNCLELLPFICYDDSFTANATVTDVNSTSAMLSWQAAPGDISHYRLEVEGDKTRTKELYNLTYALVDLIPGTRYSVQVFPVKCERDLDPQEVTFYTDPHKVQNLSVTSVTDTSVSLRWDKPVGNVDAYVIKVAGREFENDTEAINITDLIPGNQYTFTVLSVVEDKSKKSEESNITAYTKPGRVSNLKASNNTNNLLLLTWEPPKGNAEIYRVTAMDDSNVILFNTTVNITQETVDNLPTGSRITLTVTVLVGGILRGDTVTIFSHTAPGPISNLTLVATNNSISANWIAPPGNYSFFIVKLQLKGKDEKTENVTEPEKCFKGLKTAANYTVTVYIVSGHNLQGPPVSASTFTLPEPPKNARASDVSKDQITFQWDPPDNADVVSYSVKLTSTFWSYSKSADVKETNTYTFTGLKSGTKYEFEVQVVTGDQKSDPAKASNQTVPEKREISLSMLCSSADLLHCDNSTTRKNVFTQLEAYFKNKLEDNIFWKLEEYKTNN